MLMNLLSPLLYTQQHQFEIWWSFRCWSVEKTFFFFYEQRVEEHVCTNFIRWCRVDVEFFLQSRKQKVNVLFMRWCTFWKPEAITTSFCSQNKNGIDVNAIWQTCIVHCEFEKWFESVSWKYYLILVKSFK